MRFLPVPVRRGGRMPLASFRARALSREWLRSRRLGPKRMATSRRWTFLTMERVSARMTGYRGGDSTSGDESSDGGTTPGGQRLAELPRNNPEAADLLDHWGHRRIQEITETLSLVEPAAEDNADGLRALQAAVQAESEGVP